MAGKYPPAPYGVLGMLPRHSSAVVPCTWSNRKPTKCPIDGTCTLHPGSLTLASRQFVLDGRRVHGGAKRGRKNSTSSGGGGGGSSTSMGARNAPPPALDFSFHPQGKLLADVDDADSPKPMPVSPCVSPAIFQPSIHGSAVSPVAPEPNELFVETVKISPVPVSIPVAAEKATGAVRFLKEDTSSLPSPKAMKNGRVPLEKGYSQVEWMKRMQNESDLAGHKGKSRTRLLSLSEVRKHSSEKDAWTILRGRVYNITPYLSFHPGGREMLLKGAGKDCTALFNKYHAWVNAEFLLEKCLVGVLEFASET